MIPGQRVGLLLIAAGLVTFTAAAVLGGSTPRMARVVMWQQAIGYPSDRAAAVARYLVLFGTAGLAWPWMLRIARWIRTGR